MGRKREKPPGAWYIWNRPGNIWYAYQKDANGERGTPVTTGKRKSEYTRDQIERIVNEIQGITPRKIENDLSIKGVEEIVYRHLRVNQYKKNTYYQFSSTFKHLKTIYNDDYSVLNITSKDVDTVKEYFLKIRLLPDSCNTYLSTIRWIFRILQRQHIIGDNPFKEYRRFKTHESKRRKKYLTPTELDEFIKLAEKKTDPEFVRLCLILADTGKRRNEIMLLTHKDVDLDKGFYYPTDPKNDDYRQTKRIPEGVEHQFEYFIRNYSDREFPFRICHPDTFTHKVGKLLRELGHDFHKAVHALRYTNTEELKRRGYTEAEIARIQGKDVSSVVHYLRRENDDSPSILEGTRLAELYK